MSLLSEDAFRREVNALAVRTGPCPLKDRVMRELRRGSDSTASYYKRRSTALDDATKWARANLLETMSAGDSVEGAIAFAQFCEKHPTHRKGPRPMGIKVFYRALETAGFTLDRSFAQVFIEGVRLAP